MEDPKNAKDDISDGELEDANGGSDDRLKRRRRKRRLTLEPGDFEKAASVLKSPIIFTKDPKHQKSAFNTWHYRGI